MNFFKYEHKKLIVRSKAEDFIRCSTLYTFYFIQMLNKVSPLVSNRWFQNHLLLTNGLNTIVRVARRCSAYISKDKKKLLLI